MTDSDLADLHLSPAAGVLYLPPRCTNTADKPPRSAHARATHVPVTWWMRSSIASLSC